MKKTIIIIENDRAVAEIMDYVLTEAGYTVQHVNPRDHVQAVFKLKPGLILLDCFLSGELSGHDICLSLKNNIVTRHIPVVLVSAATGLDKIAIDCCADDVLRKPFDITDLEHIAYKWLDTGRAALSVS
ncbi:response regulator [Mucilaginibacter limnophilus]|uniref:Response regulator n=1 Tax=Mucilaginibacter limnophilus TaxID=1932778 RepID=A0A437MSK5_9SPHI|nr:response regulator [Mucilaginibacter limnophilus]RVU00635.1 response regulator [Mucilaginibacter limnophilus]